MANNPTYIIANKTDVDNIADAIREVTLSTSQMELSDMPERISSIETGGI